MSTNWSVNGVVISKAQSEVLRRFATEAEIPLDDLDPRTQRAMESKGYATIEAMTLKATDKGKAAGKQLAGGKPAATVKKKDAPPQPRKANGKLSASPLADLREQIETRYREDIAALDRADAIAKRIGL